MVYQLWCYTSAGAVSVLSVVPSAGQDILSGVVYAGIVHSQQVERNLSGRLLLARFDPGRGP